MGFFIRPHVRAKTPPQDWVVEG